MGGTNRSTQRTASGLISLILCVLLAIACVGCYQLYTMKEAAIVTQNQLKEQLNEVLSTLTEREAKVMRMRYGLENGRQQTLEDVGKALGVTRERIRQIEAKALRKLKHYSRSKKLQGYID